MTAHLLDTNGKKIGFTGLLDTGAIVSVMPIKNLIKSGLHEGRPNSDESPTRFLCGRFLRFLCGRRTERKDRFACDLGLYQWKKMPFGLCNATATFQRLMAHALTGVTKKTGTL